MRCTSSAPDLSSFSVRVSETVSTAILSGTNCLGLVDSRHGYTLTLHHDPLIPRLRGNGQIILAQSPRYSESAVSVLQELRSPELKPFMNQRLRWAEVPWVKESGTT